MFVDVGILYKMFFTAYSWLMIIDYVSTVDSRHHFYYAIINVLHLKIQKISKIYILKSNRGGKVKSGSLPAAVIAKIT